MEKDYEKIILKINKLIDLEMFEDSYYNIRKLKNSSFSNQNVIEILERKLNDSKKIKELKNNNLYEKMLEFKRLGKLNGYYEDYYAAHQYFSAGLYVTGYVDFYYYLAVNYFRMNRQGEAVKYFKKYIKNGGYNKLAKTYKYLYRCIRIFSKKERYDYFDEYKSYKKINKFLENEFISEIEYDFDKTDIQNIIDQFDSYENLKKIRALKYLYQKNFISVADRLYKKYKNDFKEDKSINKEHSELVKNKTLYMNQGKFNCK